MSRLFQLAIVEQSSKLIPRVTDKMERPDRQV